MKRHITFLLTAATALLLLLAGCGRDVETVKKRYLANGEKYLAQGKVKEAAIMFRNAIKRDPKYGEAYAKLGDAEMQRGEVMGAIAAYRRAVDLMPNAEDSAGKLADIFLAIYTMRGRKDARLIKEVEDVSAQLLQKDPNSYHGLRLKGYLAINDNRLTEALESFRKADQIRPKRPELRYTIAQTLGANNQWPEAEAVAVQIIKDAPAFGPAYDLLDQEYRRRNEPAKAEQILTQRVANNPKTADYRLRLADFYSTTGRAGQADKVIAELLAKESEDPSIRLKVGDYFVRAQQTDKALETYRAGVEKHPADKGAYHLRMAQVLLAQGKGKEAIVVVDQALADNPKSNDALSLRASLQLQYGGKDQQQGAVNDLQTLIGRDPKNVVVRYNLGRALQSRGELDAARVQYDEAIKNSANYIPARIGSAQVALAKRDFTRAIQDSDAALKLEPNNVAARVVRVNALINSQNLRQARVDLEAYLKNGPSSPDLEFQMGITDFLEKNYREAEVRFRSLRERFPADQRLMFAVTEVMVQTGRGKEGLKFLQAELAKDNANTTLRMGVAATARKTGEMDVAEAEYRTLLAAEPKNVDTYLRLGEVLRLKGQVQAAVDVLRKGQQLAPNNPSANLQLALTLETAGQTKEALPIYENVVRLDPENVIALNNLAFQYADLNRDLDMAMTYAQKAKQRAPNSDDISDTLGWVYVKKRLNDSAIVLYRDLLKRQPKNPLYHFHLGMALYQKGSKDEARQALQTALSLKPAKAEEALIREMLGRVG